MSVRILDERFRVALNIVGIKRKIAIDVFRARFSATRRSFAFKPRLNELFAIDKPSGVKLLKIGERKLFARNVRFDLLRDVVRDDFRVANALRRIIFVPGAFAARPRVRLKIISAIRNEKIDPHRERFHRALVDLNVLVPFKRRVGNFWAIRKIRVLFHLLPAA